MLHSLRLSLAVPRLKTPERSIYSLHQGFNFGFATCKLLHRNHRHHCRHVIKVSSLPSSSFFHRNYCEVHSNVIPVIALLLTCHVTVWLALRCRHSIHAFAITLPCCTCANAIIMPSLLSSSLMLCRHRSALIITIVYHCKWYLYHCHALLTFIFFARPRSRFLSSSLDETSLGST